MRYMLEHSDEVIVNVHDKSLCAGRPCTIHSKTDHHMRSWPQHWRCDRGFMERVCDHGIGHPDPDENFTENDVRWIHGCDRCCAK